MVMCVNDLIEFNWNDLKFSYITQKLDNIPIFEFCYHEINSALYIVRAHDIPCNISHSFSHV